MKSRYLSRLDDRIAATGHPVGRGCLMGERLVYLTRRGEPVGNEMQAFEAFARACSQAPVSAWWHLFQAIHDYFHADGARAIDQALRAHALSAASGQRRTQAIAAAWLAHFHDDRQDVHAAATRAAEAIRVSAVGDHQARARAGMIVACALTMCGRHEAAGLWFERVRCHAIAEGDELTLDACVWNRAAKRFEVWRQESLRHGDGTLADSSIVWDTESATRFEPVFRIRNLTVQAYLWNARLATMLGRFEEAAALYAGHVGDLDGTIAFRERCDVCADQAYALARLGRAAEAAAAAAQAETDLASAVPIHLEERAAAHARLAQAYGLLGDEAGQARHRAEAETIWPALDAKRAAQIEAYDDIAAESSPLPQPDFSPAEAALREVR